MNESPFAACVFFLVSVFAGENWLERFSQLAIT